MVRSHPRRFAALAGFALVALAVALANLSATASGKSKKPLPAKAVTLTLTYDGTVAVTATAKSANPKCYRGRTVVTFYTPEGGGTQIRSDFRLDDKGTSTKGFGDGTVTASIPAKTFKDVKCKSAAPKTVVVNYFP